MNAVLAILLLLLAGPALGRDTPRHVRGDDPPPDVVMLDQVAGCYGSVRFDHRLHVQMSSIQGECRNCHHELPAETLNDGKPAVRPCRTCHEPASAAVSTDKPGLRGAYHRQCLSCHKTWAHENACGFCHTDSAAVRAYPSRVRPAMELLQPRSNAQATYVYQTGHRGMPVVTFHHADHTQVFGLACADCHGGSSCGQCHGSKAERPTVNRQQSCYKCHSDSRCVTCHHLVERPRFDHEARTGWRLRPAHAALACDACHEAAAMPERPLSNACRTCHAQRWNDEEFDHARTGVVLHGDHAYFECTECHRGGDEPAIVHCDRCHAERSVAGQRWVGTESDAGGLANPPRESGHHPRP